VRIGKVGLASDRCLSEERGFSVLLLLEQDLRHRREGERVIGGEDERAPKQTLGARDVTALEMLFADVDVLDGVALASARLVGGEVESAEPDLPSFVDASELSQSYSPEIERLTHAGANCFGLVEPNQSLCRRVFGHVEERQRFKSRARRIDERGLTHAGLRCNEIALHNGLASGVPGRTRLSCGIAADRGRVRDQVLASLRLARGDRESSGEVLCAGGGGSGGRLRRFRVFGGTP